jgi:hypothetical protein
VLDPRGARVPAAMRRPGAIEGVLGYDVAVFLQTPDYDAEQLTDLNVAANPPEFHAGHGLGDGCGAVVASWLTNRRHVLPRRTEIRSRELRCARLASGGLTVDGCSAVIPAVEGPRRECPSGEVAKMPFVSRFASAADRSGLMRSVKR